MCDTHVFVLFSHKEPNLNIGDSSRVSGLDPALVQKCVMKMKEMLEDAVDRVKTEQGDPVAVSELRREKRRVMFTISTRGHRLCAEEGASS